jgi:hypothetical protein
MKRDPIEVFVPTGEVRRPKKGEWIKPTLTNDFISVIGDFTADKYPIYTREEIPIPEEAIGMWPAWNPPLYELRKRNDYIPFPIIPKPKVKKWIVLTRLYGGIAIKGADMFPILFNTREEVLAGANSYNAVEIEIEVEEP